jgi:hypothetical protein
MNRKMEITGGTTMRKIWILGLAGVLAVVLAGCDGGSSGPPIVTGPGLVGLDDSSNATAPLLTVTYTVPGTPGTATVQILSDLLSDGDIAYDPVLRSYFPTQGPSTVLFGIDSVDPDLPEYRAFLTFPLDGINQPQEVVPSNAVILSADVGVSLTFLDFASAVPTFLDLVQYPPAYGGQNGLGSINPADDFNAVVLATRPVFDFLVSDVVTPRVRVRIDVTSMMQAAQVPPALLDFQVRFSRDMSVPPLSPPRPSAGVVRTVVPAPRAMEGAVPRRQPETAKSLSPTDLAARRR